MPDLLPPPYFREDFMTKQNKIYTASRVKHAQMWRDCRGLFNITASWIDEAGEGETECFTELWKRIQEEVTEADAVVFFAEDGDAPFKGAFIECGMAIAMGKPVFVACRMQLENRSLRPIGSWLNHPLVTMYQADDCIDRALVKAATYKPGSGHPKV